jgi:Sensory domain in DIguanylate Cyclases and Two-component system
VSTPYTIVARVAPPVRARKSELLALTRRLERAALQDPPPVVVATLQDARFVTPATRDVYAALAAAGASTTLHARGLQSWLAPGVVGVSLDDDDPLVDEWTMVLPSPSGPVVFAATDLAEPYHQDLERCFLYAVSHDPEVVQACLALLAR